MCIRDRQRTLGEINGQVEETFAGQNIVKAFNKEEDVLAEFRVKNEELYHSCLLYTSQIHLQSTPDFSQPEKK